MLKHLCVCIADSALLTAKLVKRGTLKVYPGLPYGRPTRHAGRINADLLAFIKTDSELKERVA
jgi:non-heme chloroperoxidase